MKARCGERRLLSSAAFTLLRAGARRASARAGVRECSARQKAARCAKGARRSEER